MNLSFFPTRKQIRTTASLEFLLVLSFLYGQFGILSGQSPNEIQFVRQGVKRLIFSEDQSLPLARLDPATIVGINSMHPQTFYTVQKPEISIEKNVLWIRSDAPTVSSIWFGGFNPFATYSMDLRSMEGSGNIGFEFTDHMQRDRFIITISFREHQLDDARLQIFRNNQEILTSSILTKKPAHSLVPGKIILQMLGSGFNLFISQDGLPLSIGQNDFSTFLDLREKRCLQTFQSRLYISLNRGALGIRSIESGLTTGIGQADIRAITLKDGSPLLDQGRLWYTISVRGRALPHHLQGVFSINPSVFDPKLEGIIVFDREDGLLRNEISSHIFYDQDKDIWRGLTTGFSAYANLENEKKQILAIESKKDPRFGFSIMKARPIGMIGDIEDSHILYDDDVQKWRILTCENINGYKAVMLESDQWDSGYRRIAGPVDHNSTGTSIQKIGDKRFCFSGSSARKIFIYTYPYLKQAGTLQMDLPPWDPSSRTRVWPNVISLPDGYVAPFVALMMDRYNFPGQAGPHWSYGALYLYYGYND